MAFGSDAGSEIGSGSSRLSVPTFSLCNLGSGAGSLMASGSGVGSEIGSGSSRRRVPAFSFCNVDSGVSSCFCIGSLTAFGSDAGSEIGSGSNFVITDSDLNSDREENGLGCGSGS